MLFYEWKEFVTYPLNPDYVRSREGRLDTRDAFRVGLDGNYQPEYSAENNRGAIIPLSTFTFEGDVFECMEIDDFGRVTVWTRDKVWFLTREGNNGRIEKLRFLPRHPPNETH